MQGEYVYFLFLFYCEMIRGVSVVVIVVYFFICVEIIVRDVDLMLCL